MEVKAHAEQMSDGMGLINATGTKAPDIEFLERHHIWLASGITSAIRRGAARPSAPTHRWTL